MEVWAVLLSLERQYRDFGGLSLRPVQCPLCAKSGHSSAPSFRL